MSEAERRGWKSGMRGQEVCFGWEGSRSLADRARCHHTHTLAQPTRIIWMSFWRNYSHGAVRVEAAVVPFLLEQPQIRFLHSALSQSQCPYLTHSAIMWTPSKLCNPGPPSSRGHAVRCEIKLQIWSVLLSPEPLRRRDIPNWWFYKYKVYKECDGDRESDWADQCVTAEVSLAYVSQAAVNGLEGRRAHLSVRKRPKETKQALPQALKRSVYVRRRHQKDQNRDSFLFYERGRWSDRAVLLFLCCVPSWQRIWPSVRNDTEQKLLGERAWWGAWANSQTHCLTLDGLKLLNGNVGKKCRRGSQKSNSMVCNNTSAALPENWRSY